MKSLFYDVADYMKIGNGMRKQCRKIVALIFFVVFIASCSEAPDKLTYNAQPLQTGKKYHVILMGGQSNMVGRGSVSELNEKLRVFPDNITYFNPGLTQSPNICIETFGPEVSSAHILAEKHLDKNFVLIKFAVDGSSLIDWSPNWSYEKAKLKGKPNLGPLYSRFLSQLKNQIHENVTVISLLWMQGEADATYSVPGSTYYDNFKEFINQIRKDLHCPDLPVIFGRVNPPLSVLMYKTVRNAQQRISQEIPNTVLVDTDMLSKHPDNIHYDTEGQLKLGEMFGEALLKFMDTDTILSP
jgi:hypothetical protein